MEPIEIKPEDIIRRPANLGKTALIPKIGESQSTLGTIKAQMKQVKEILDIAKQIGFPVDKLKNFLPGMEVQELEPEPKVLPTKQPQQQSPIKLIHRFLTASYGDITMSELAERLKKDYGNKKLSDIKFGE